MQQSVSTVPMSPIPPKKNNKPFFIIVGVLIIVLLILLGAYFFVQNGGQISSQSNPTPSSIPTVSIPTPTIAPPSAFSVTITLIKSKSTPVPGTDLVLTYKEGSKPNENCADCIASTVIELQQNQRKKMLSYSCGGIVGTCTNLQEGFGYKVELSKEIDEQKIEVLITK